MPEGLLKLGIVYRNLMFLPAVCRAAILASRRSGTMPSPSIGTVATSTW